MFIYQSIESEKSNLQEKNEIHQIKLKYIHAIQGINFLHYLILL